jgi:hypothetical protein
VRSLVQSPEAAIHFTGGNHRGMANDRDEIAVASCLHPDYAEAVLGVLVGDALNQPGKHLSVGWLWLRLDASTQAAIVRFELRAT